MSDSEAFILSKQRFTPKIHKIIFWIAIIWVIFYFTLSIFLYSLTYSFSFLDVWISSLGNTELNVLSIYIFNPGVILTSVFLALHYIYLFYHFPIKWKIIKYLLEFLLFVGCIGFGLIGIFTDNIQPMHDIMAGLAFGGLGLGYFFIDIFLIIFYIQKIMAMDKNITNMTNNSNEKAKSLLYMIITLLTIIFLVISVGIFISGGINYMENVDWIIIWEWLAFLALGINIIVVGIQIEYLHDNKNDNKVYGDDKNVGDGKDDNEF